MGLHRRLNSVLCCCSFLTTFPILIYCILTTIVLFIILSSGFYCLSFISSLSIYFHLNGLGFIIGVDFGWLPFLVPSHPTPATLTSCMEPQGFSWKPAFFVAVCTFLWVREEDVFHCLQGWFRPHSLALCGLAPVPPAFKTFHCSVIVTLLQPHLFPYRSLNMLQASIPLPQLPEQLFLSAWFSKPGTCLNFNSSSSFRPLSCLFFLSVRSFVPSMWSWHTTLCSVPTHCIFPCSSQPSSNARDMFFFTPQPLTHPWLNTGRVVL